ncbi:M15 family peptidase [Clostridium chromiireducens]|uniref:M15 family peptidase n=1 Tax=Clostridium chromiireducens TaxID=225345 RepID=A0A964RNT6_9CLOT|nr:M15 family metallopeptidase [Clostridium chromiireducens]MVX65066.1 M15 family peptidase [Clostridium chromiireducens]
MKKINIFIVSILIIINIPVISKVPAEKDYKTQMKQDVLILMLAYPEYIQGVEKKSDDEVYLIMKSGKKIIYDDMKNKNHEEKLANPDLQDMLEQEYPLQMTTEIMKKDFDPGRARHYELFSEVYGGSKGVIEKNLTNLKFGYTNYQFNKNNKANTSLDAVFKELIPLAKTRGDIGSILYPASGTYNYRVISGTGRLSPHSYGIAIDLKSDKRDYWKWSSEIQGQKRLLDYPKELIEAFERNNFVWGGKWNHFDILHFEYRPEIILKAKYFGKWDGNHEWYYGSPVDENTKNHIEIIDNALQ